MKRGGEFLGATSAGCGGCRRGGRAIERSHRRAGWPERGWERSRRRGERYIDLEGDVNCRILDEYKRWMLPFPDNHSQGNRRRRGSVLEVEVEKLLLFFLSHPRGVVITTSSKSRF